MKHSLTGKCYGFSTIINIFTFTVRGSTSDSVDPAMTTKVDPRAVRVKVEIAAAIHTLRWIINGEKYVPGY